MLARLLGFTLGNGGGLAPKIDSTSVRNACLLLKGPKCCVLIGVGSGGGRGGDSPPPPPTLPTVYIMNFIAVL